MITSTPLSVCGILQIVGRNILSFLSEEDILCNLQYVSSDMLRFFSSSSQVLWEFIYCYFLGPTLRQEAGLNLKTLRLITFPHRKLVSPNEIPNNVLYSMITGITRARYILVPFGEREQYEALDKYLDVGNPISPINRVKAFTYVTWITPPIHLQLYWSGQWGIFGRLKLENTDGGPLQLFAQLSVTGHRQITKSSTEGFIHSRRQVKQSVMREVIRSDWADFMIGVIDAQNVQKDQEYHQRFERLNVPIDISVRLWFSYSTAKQFWDFVYLWPLEEQYNRELYSEDFHLSNQPWLVETIAKLQKNKKETKIHTRCSCSSCRWKELMGPAYRKPHLKKMKST